MRNAENLKEEFLLDRDVTFLNHGSFGACPRKVFETYQNWQRELEQQPVAYFRRLPGLLAESRRRLGDYVGARAEDLVYVTNVTFGLNIVIRSLDLKPGDEILTTDHEYWSLDRSWDMISRKRDWRIIPVSLPLPVTTPEEAADRIWSGVTDKTRVLFLSHITSPTALILPVKELVDRARKAGIMTIIDGAHAPGQIPVNLTELGADFYSANCHKWMLAPKGAGFLHARPEFHEMLEPLSGGRNPDLYENFDSHLIAEHQYQGTRDCASFLSVPAAIDFMEENNWLSQREECYKLVCYARELISSVTGAKPLIPESTRWFRQMGLLPLPKCDGPALKNRLYDDYKVEIPHISWGDRDFLRISIQAYNTRDDVDRLAEALKAII